MCVTFPEAVSAYTQHRHISSEILNKAELFQYPDIVLLPQRDKCHVCLCTYCWLSVPNSFLQLSASTLSFIKTSPCSLVQSFVFHLPVWIPSYHPFFLNCPISHFTLFYHGESHIFCLLLNSKRRNLRSRDGWSLICVVEEPEAAWSRQQNSSVAFLRVCYFHDCSGE